MPEGPYRDDGIDKWCKQVWSVFSANRSSVAALVSEYKIA
jgi:hypothetical protein